MIASSNRAKLIWITGLSGSGKTTIGTEVYKQLKQKEENTFFLDGDAFRKMTGNRLSYNATDRLENAKGIHRMCVLLTSQNINVVCSTVSLYSQIHNLNRKNIKDYYEIFIDCNMDELIRRDQKGLYSIDKKNTVGVGLDYDKPTNCDLAINNNKQDNLIQKAEKILNLIRKSK